MKVELIHADTGTGGHDDLATMRTRLDIGVVAWLITLGGEGGMGEATKSTTGTRNFNP